LIANAIHALGQLRLADSVPVLSSLLAAGALERLYRAWHDHSQQLSRLAPEHWPLDRLPSDRRSLVVTTLAVCETPADRPSSLDELLKAEAARLSNAAAAALALIGGTMAQHALYRAILTHPALDRAPALIAALDQLDGTTGTLLPMLLREPEIDPMTRWTLV